MTFYLEKGYKIMFKQILHDINTRSRSKKDLLEYYVAKRLDKSTTNYYKDLVSKCNTLKSYDEFKVMKKIVRGK